MRWWCLNHGDFKNHHGLVGKYRIITHYDFINPMPIIPTGTGDRGIISFSTHVASLPERGFYFYQTTITTIQQFTITHVASLSGRGQVIPNS